MATSVLMASDEINFSGFEESSPENGKQRGRRKSKSKEVSQRKKQPQRGMGVEQLERLRLQERWKKMSTTTTTQITTNPPLQPPPINPHANHYFPNPNSFPDPKSFGCYGPMNGVGVGVGLNQSLLIQKVGNGGISGQVVGRFPAGPFEFGSLNSCFRAGNLAELSSMPNMNCISDQCDLCHKKKRGNGENFGCNGMRNKYADETPINGSGFLGFNLGNKQNVDQEIEILAVHRKKGSSSTGGGSGSLFMEYEFFPGKFGRGTCSEDLELGSCSSSGGEVSCLATTPIVSTGFDASSNSVDLSLKLSY